MSAENDKEAFLSRWSRRKLAAKHDAPSAVPAAEAQAAAAAVSAPAAESPAAEAPQGGSPEYQEFFDPRVEEKLRRSALKKLFSEPQFNVMDGLDTYIDDYSKPDPIPEAMLRRMNQAKELFLFDDEKKTTADVGDAASAASANAAAAPSSVAESALPTRSPAGGTGDEAGAATDASGTAPAQGGINT